MQIPQIYALTSFLSMQNEAEVAFSESNALRKTCEAAEKAQEDLKEKSTVAQVFTGVPLLPTLTDSVRNSLKWKVFSKTICVLYTIQNILSIFLYSLDQSAGAGATTVY